MNLFKNIITQKNLNLYKHIKYIIAPTGMDKISKIVKKHHDGAIINLFVTPRAQSTIFPAGYNKWRRCIEIKVNSPAKDNKANKDVIKTIAEFLDKPVKDVFVISGIKNRSKSVLIKGISAEVISERLKESMDGL